MIYEECESRSPIRQGDIFRDLPRIECSLKRLPVVSEDRFVEQTWLEAVETSASGGAVTALATLRPAMAIVLSQDCDATRSAFISVAEVVPFREILGGTPKSPHKWQSLIVKQSRENLRYFYLPETESIGIGERMAADFRIVFQVRREELEHLAHLRLGRLNRVATEHFRESVAQFFRRYPYDEWYSLTKEEFEAYCQATGDVVPFPWQEKAASSGE